MSETYHNRRFQHSGSPVVGYFAGRKPHLLAMDAATVKEIMIKNFASFADNELSDMMSVASDPVIARNPFFAKSSEWKDLRKDIAVAFTHIRVKSYYPIIQSVCQKLRTYLDKQCSMSSVVDIDEVNMLFYNNDHYLFLTFKWQFRPRVGIPQKSFPT